MGCALVRAYYSVHSTSNYFTLHVKEFAKIREAKIEAAPLTLFVGDNNSGKSYLLSLLWGLTGGVNFGLLPSVQKRYRERKFDGVERLLDLWKIKNYEESNDDLDPLFSFKHTLPVTTEEQSILAKEFNCFLAEVIAELVSEIFNTDEICIQSLCLDFPSKADLMVGYKGHDDGLPWTLGIPNHGWHAFQYKNAFDLIERYIDLVLDKSVFVPAPRTGYLLTFGTLTQQSIHAKFSFNKGHESGDILTSPQVSFLKRRAAIREQDLDKFKEPIKKIIDFVERNIIRGEIKLTKTPLPEILYKPEGLDQTLPLYLTSGVVAEVAGFLSLLKFGQFGRTCIYEEPEMCLHSELQWKMARVLVKLVNAGFTVWASTHSDIIIQHANNMINLSNLQTARSCGKSVITTKMM